MSLAMTALTPWPALVLLALAAAASTPRPSIAHQTPPEATEIQRLQLEKLMLENRKLVLETEKLGAEHGPWGSFSSPPFVALMGVAILSGGAFPTWGRHLRLR